MNETKHTKGPWFTGVDGIRIGLDYRDEHGNMSKEALVSSNGWMKTVCKVNYAQYINHEALANAHLIAAAPDMFDAMLEFVERVDSGTIKSNYTYNRFQAVLAAARGES